MWEYRLISCRLLWVNVLPWFAQTDVSFFHWNMIFRKVFPSMQSAMAVIPDWPYNIYIYYICKIQNLILMLNSHNMFRILSRWWNCVVKLLRNTGHTVWVLRTSWPCGPYHKQSLSAFVSYCDLCMLGSPKGQNVVHWKLFAFFANLCHSSGSTKWWLHSIHIFIYLIYK
jgi:hypothetical protein